MGRTARLVYSHLSIRRTPEHNCLRIRDSPNFSSNFDGATCAIDLGGEAYCWGRNEERQLGVGEGVSYGEPALIQFE